MTKTIEEQIAEARIAELERSHAEALREARVQGIYEGYRLVVGMLDMWDTECASKRFDHLVEAVRKGER